MTGQRRTRVFLTGATGNWGRVALAAFARHPERFELVVLVLPTPAERRAIRRLTDGMDSVETVFGDLTDPVAVERCVRGADVVVHLGAVVSPLADEHPELAHRVNVESMCNIVATVRAQPNPSAIGVIGVGTVGQTGDRPPPHHWGRVGDPVRVSTFDDYSLSKVTAERVLVDSGLPKWVQLRQTGLFHDELAAVRDAIVTHPPLDEVMEWATAEDSSRLLVGACGPDVPDGFWGGIHNIGGGEAWRLTNWEFQELLGRAMGVPDMRRWYRREWFATRNFHGQWFTDSDRLEALVPFRQDTPERALARMVAAAPRAVRAAGRVPPWIIRDLVMGPLTRRPRGTMSYVRAGDEAGISAYYGSREAFEAIGDWSTFEPPAPSRVPSELDHGYDEGRPEARWDAAMYAGAAAFRGGELLTGAPVTGDVATPLEWRCAFGHVFTASPRLVLRGGHWCPECTGDTTAYAAQAERSAFLAQLT